MNKGNSIYVFEELVKVECIEGIDRVVKGGMGSIDGSVEFIHAVLDQMGTVQDIHLLEFKLGEKLFIRRQLPILFLALQFLKVRH